MADNPKRLEMPRIRRALGIAWRDKPRYSDMLALCKSGIVDARRSGDDARAAELSAAKEVLKKKTRRYGKCAVCGRTIKGISTHCKMHAPSTTKLKVNLIPA